MLEQSLQIDPKNLILYQGAAKLAGLTLEQITVPLKRIGLSEFRLYGSETNMGLFSRAYSIVNAMPRNGIADELNIALGNITPEARRQFQEDLVDFLHQNQ